MMNSLYHHGIQGQKWGVRHGPPYPLKGGDYSPEEKKHLRPKNRVFKNSNYSKKHYDKTISADSDIQTLSANKDRLKNTDMFYASYDDTDKRLYRYKFNQKVPQEIKDENGEVIGTGQFYKNKIDAHSTQDLKIASEDSGAAAFKKLYKEQRDFYNFVAQRMEPLFVRSKYRFKGYREVKPVLAKLESGTKLTEGDVNVLYRMFNYVLPNDGAGDARVAKDVATQRARFFKELKSQGYSGVLDTNDALYGGYHANAPVIIFDMDKIVPDSVKQLDFSDRVVSFLAYRGKKIMGK